MANDTAAFIAEISEIVAPYCSELGLGERRAIALTRAWIEYKRRTTGEIFMPDLKAFLDKVMEAVVTVAVIDFVAEAKDEPEYYAAFDERGIFGGRLSLLKPSVAPVPAAPQAEEAREAEPPPLPGVRYEADGTPIGPGYMSRAERSAVARVGQQRRRARERAEQEARAVSVTTSTEITSMQTTRETTTTTVFATAGGGDEHSSVILDEAPGELEAGLLLADAPTADCPPHRWDVNDPRCWVCRKCGAARVPVARKWPW